MLLEFHSANSMPLCHLSATQTSQVPLDIREFMGPCLYSTASSLDAANRSLPSIEGSGRLAGCGDEPIQCHLRPKTLDWHRIWIVRVPPLKIFWGPLDQWEASISSSRPIRSLGFGQIRGVGRIWSLPIWHQCANWLTIEWHWTTNGMPIDCQLKADWQPMVFQLKANGMSIDYQWNANWIQKECQLNSNWMPIEIKTDANCDPIWCISGSHQTPIEIQSYNNWDPFQY